MIENAEKISLIALKSIDEIKQIETILNILSKELSEENSPYEAITLIELLLEKAGSIRRKQSKIAKILDNETD